LSAAPQQLNNRKYGALPAKALPAVIKIDEVSF
jgi:hypothetical protein